MQCCVCSRCTESVSLIHISFHVWILFHIGYYRMLCRPLLVFGMSLAIRYFISISVCLLNPISYVIHSSHLSIWLTTSLFSEYVSVLLCGNKFININFYITPIRDIIGYVSLAFWLTSSCMIICSIIYGAANGIVLILFCVWYSIVYTDLSFVHSSDDGHFCCFHKYCCNTRCSICVFLILVFTGARPNSEPSRPYGNSMFTFSTHCHSVPIIGCYHFTSHLEL